MNLDSLKAEIKAHKRMVIRIFLYKKDGKLNGTYHLNFEVQGGDLVTNLFVNEYRVNHEEIDRVSFMTIDEAIQRNNTFMILGKSMSEVLEKAGLSVTAVKEQLKNIHTIA